MERSDTFSDFPRFSKNEVFHIITDLTICENLTIYLIPNIMSVILTKNTMVKTARTLIVSERFSLLSATKESHLIESLLQVFNQLVGIFDSGGESYRVLLHSERQSAIFGKIEHRGEKRNTNQRLGSA